MPSREEKRRWWWGAGSRGQNPKSPNPFGVDSRNQTWKWTAFPNVYLLMLTLHLNTCPGCYQMIAGEPP